MAVPASVTRRVSEGDYQVMFGIRRERPGVRLGAMLSSHIKRRRPSLTQRVTGTANQRMHPPSRSPVLMDVRSPDFC